MVTRKALLIEGIIHGIEVDDTTKEIVKDYGPVVRQEHCPCKGNAHLVEGPVFFLNMRRVYRNIPWKGSVDTVFHDGVYCLPENAEKFWCNRLHAIGEAARKFLDKKQEFACAALSAEGEAA